MADPFYKVTYYFRSGTRGWSESYFIQRAAPDEASTRAIVVGKIRALCLASTASFQAVTLRPELPSFGPSFFTDDSLTWPTASGSADQQNVCVNLVMRANNRHRRTYQVRGLPDNSVQWDLTADDPVLQPDARAAVVNYGNALQNNTAVLKVRRNLREDPTGSKVVSFGPVTNDPSQTLVTLAAPVAGLDVNVDVQIMGCRRTAHRANGLRLVTLVPTATTFQIDWPFGNIFEYDALDIVTALVRIPATDWYLTRATNIGSVAARKPGRPFFVSRGRSTNRPH